VQFDGRKEWSRQNNKTTKINATIIFRTYATGTNSGRGFAEARRQIESKQAHRNTWAFELLN
jgi:hypothetical protein